MKNPKKLEELRQRIDEVLFYRRDPIGVSHLPSARGEYSSYVKGLVPQVLQGEARRIADHLSEIQRSSMGGEVTAERNLEVAQYLLEVKEAVEKGWR
ncbi:MAG: hypothetical protein AAFR61_07525 [Bacteroidota bacterium]